MTWSDTRKRLLSLAARRADQRIVPAPRWPARDDDEDSSLESTPESRGNGHTSGRAGPPGAGTTASNVRAASLAVASGKGGTGKSCVSASLASLFSARGRTLIVDGDLGVGNAHILQNVSPAKTMVDVVEGGASMRDVVVGCAARVDLVAAGSGVPRMAELSSYEMHLVANGLEDLERDYRFLVVDSAAGVSRQTLSFAGACDLTLVVTTPDLTAMTDAYAFLKVLLSARRRPLLLVNRARDDEQANEVTGRIVRVCERFMGTVPIPIGWLPEDPLVGECVNRRGAVVDLEPHAPASRALRKKAVTILDELRATRAGGLGRRLLDEVGYCARFA